MSDNLQDSLIQAHKSKLSDENEEIETKKTVPQGQQIRGLTVSKLDKYSSDSFEVPAEELNPKFPA